MPEKPMVLQRIKRTRAYWNFLKPVTKQRAKEQVARKIRRAVESTADRNPNERQQLINTARLEARLALLDHCYFEGPNAKEKRTRAKIIEARIMEVEAAKDFCSNGIISAKRALRFYQIMEDSVNAEIARRKSTKQSRISTNYPLRELKRLAAQKRKTLIRRDPESPTTIWSKLLEDTYSLLNVELKEVMGRDAENYLNLLNTREHEINRGDFE